MKFFDLKYGYPKMKTKLMYDKFKQFYKINFILQRSLKYGNS